MASGNESDKQRSTREHIKKTFLSIYRTTPLNKIFVSNLVLACSISRGTFYFHFESIEQLYHECERDLIQKMESGLDKVQLCTVGGSRKNMSQFIHTYSAHLARYPQWEELFLCLLEGSESVSFQRRWVESVYNHFQQVLPFSRNIPQNKVEFLLHFFSGGEVHMLSRWVLNGFTEPTEEVASVSAQVLFCGAYSADGNEG